MAAELILVNDIVGKRLYKGSLPSGRLVALEQFSFASIYQGEAYLIKYVPVVPSGNQLSPWTQVSVTNLTLKMGIGPKTGAEARKVAQDTWAKVTTADSLGLNNYLTALFDLNTTDLNTAIASADSYASTFEIQLGESGVYRVTYQSGITINATVIDPTGSASLPVPAAAYYTKNEVNNGFMSFTGAAGEARIWTSQNGKQCVQRYVDQPDGSAAMQFDPLN